MTSRLMAIGIALLCFALAGQAAAQNPEDLIFDANILWNCDGGTYNGNSGGANCPGGAYTTEELATVHFTNNREVDPLLVDPNNYGDPDLSPQATSPALCENGASVVAISEIDPWFDTVSYNGALNYTGGDPLQDWTRGWTYHNYEGGLGRSDIDESKTVVQLTFADSITVDTTWSNDNNYELYGNIRVKAPATLTIEKGTVVKGMPGFNAYVAVDRGARLVAIGTADEPIIFTSGADWTIGDQLPGDWAGIIFHGRAVANCASGGTVPGCNSTATGNDCESEGDGGRLFGGDDDDDDSGICRYARIEYSGFELAPNNELNCWTWNAVGRNSTMEYLQAAQGTDDGFEWFGGSLRAKYLLATANADDNLDWQMGWRGYVQYAAVIQHPDYPGDKGIEADNNEFDNDCPGRSNPYLSNLTIVGEPAASDGINLRRGTAGMVVNSIVFEAGAECLDIDDEATFANCPGPTPPLFDCNIIGVAETPAPAVGRFAIAAAPNPVFASSTFSFSLQDEASVRLSVYDATGRMVEQVFSGRLDAGDHAFEWTPKNVTSGVYYYKATADAREATGKLLVLD
jgi:hypothetical protein